MDFILIFWVVVGIIVYFYGIFKFSVEIDNYLYYEGVNVTRKMCNRYGCHVLMWPLTLWFNKCWEVK